MNRRKLLIMAMAIIGAITQSSTLCMAAESNQCVRYCEVDAKEVASESSSSQILLFGKKSKTVKRTYSDRSSIPAGIYYEEYIDGHMWGGILNWTGEVKSLGYGVYEATFSGKLERID